MAMAGCSGGKGLQSPNKRGRSPGTALFYLYVKPEVHHVPVLHHVIFSFNTQLAIVPGRSFRSVLDIIFVSNDLRFDEALLKIRMDNTGSLRSLPSVLYRPGPDFLYSGRKIGGQVQ